MRKTLLLLWLFIAVEAIGQSSISLDCQRLSSRDIDGTARYVGMAGAMTAIGGDPSAVMDNPAGLGLYRHSEVMMTLAVRPETTKPLATGEKWTTTGFNVKQVSAVFAMYKPYRTSGIVGNNIMLNFQRMKTYDSRYKISGVGRDRSLTHVAADNLSYDYRAFLYGPDVRPIYPTEMNDVRWDRNEDIGWLSGLCYQTWLIDPNYSDSANYHSLLKEGEKYTTDLIVEEMGHSNHFSIDYSMNVSNRFYWGLGMNIAWLDYYKSATYREGFGGESFNVRSVIQQKGVGVSGSVGVLYRPVQAFRIGASFQTPTIMKLNSAFDGQVISTLEMLDSTGTRSQMETFSKTTPYIVRYTDNKFTTPLRFSISPAAQIGKYALIAFQYDLSHWKNTANVHTFKVGVEGAIKGNWLLEAGYAYESSFMKLNEQPIFALPVNTVRLDTDWRNIYNSQYASIGFGYHGNFAIAHIAYQCRWQRSDVYAHEIALPAGMQTLTHNIVISIAWHSL